MVPFDLVRHDIGHLVRAHLGDAGVVLYLAGKPLGSAVCLGVDGKLSAVRQMDQDVAGELEGSHFVFQTEARCGLGDRQLELSGGRDVVHDAAG